MSAMVQYEPSVNTALETFLDKTEAFFVSTKATCDFAQWLQFLAFDVVGQMTYSKRHGFIDRNEDVDGMVAWLGNLFSYVAPVSHLHPSSTSTITHPNKSRSAKSHSSTTCSSKTPSSASSKC